MWTDHRPKQRKEYRFIKCPLQRLGRESAELNHKKHSRPLVRVQINSNDTHFGFLKCFSLDEKSNKYKNTVTQDPTNL
jgi:hypothetical protein